MQPFESPPGYIDHETQKTLVRDFAAQAVHVDRCFALYFRANGGLGKTHLFKRLPDILQGNAEKLPDLFSSLCIVQPIDLYNFETRSPTVIEQRLIAGLRRSSNADWYRLEPAAVDQAFAPYHEVLAEYRRHRDVGSAEELAANRLTLRRSFVACLNHVTAQRPLILCFDTLETLFNTSIPPEAFVNASEGGTGADLVIEWMHFVLPRLQHTLVLLCGRPHAADTRLINALSEILTPEHVQELKELKDPADIREYLAAYKVNVADTDLPYVQQITANHPLLLTCYAETHRDQGSLGQLKRPKRFKSKAAFEDWLVSTILDPLPALATREDGQKTLILSLYFLLYARRGIRANQLRELFGLLNTSFAPLVIDNLDQLALVKTDGERLFLHDEIFRIIDTSKQGDGLGAQDQTLEYLCNVSAQEVRQASDRASLLRSMTDHVYYELLRDLQKGYRVYTVYADRLLRERNTNSALVLCDAFWTMFAPLHQQRTLRGLTYDEIIRDELVRQVKFLHARDRSSAAAVDLANTLYQQFSAEGLLSPEDEEKTGAAAPADPYLFVDLNISRVIAIAQSQPQGYDDRVERIFAQVIALLEALDTPTEETYFLFLRRQFFLGEAYTLRSYLLHEQQQFDQALEDGERGRRAFRAYREDAVAGAPSAEALLYDETLTDLAQAANNMAYTLALSGKLDEARRRSDRIVERYVPHVSDYRRALFCNTYGLTLMLMGNYLDARKPIEDAAQAAKASGIPRAMGLVSRSSAQLARAEMRSHGVPDPMIEEIYQQADNQLKNDSVTRFDLIYDWAGFLRDTGKLYRVAGDTARALHYEERALKKLDQGRTLLGTTQAMQIADLCESKAAIYNNMEQYAPAAAQLDEADSYMVQPMPRYGQVVSGKIALQRGVIALFAEQDYQQALHFMTIGLARVYAFAEKHRDQGIFEHLIETWLKDIPDAGASAFWQATQTGLNVAEHDLPYQHLAPEVWDRMLTKSLMFVRDAIEAHLDL